MIHIDNPEDCCGCTACASSCAHNAISMQPDILGFKYPKVNLNSCVDCGVCEKVCAFNDNYNIELNFLEPIAIAGRHKEISEVMKSRSGALFVAISDFIIKNNGVVYGVGYHEHFIVTHKRAVTRFERDEFRGSKYVQSDLSGIFHKIRKDLIEGKQVMFVGTACQTAGLNSYIGKKLRNSLLLVDIVCHGTPGPRIWQDYIANLERLNNARLNKVNFRDKKTYGWTSHRETLEFENALKVSPEKSFYRSLFFRKSCGKCHYCNIHRPSDITLADFWGWEKQDTEINQDDRGVNLILINTNKGLDVFDNIKEDINYFEVSGNSYLQPNLCHATPNHPYRDVFEDDYKKKGFRYAFYHNYDNPTLRDRVKRLSLKYLKR